MTPSQAAEIAPLLLKLARHRFVRPKESAIARALADHEVALWVAAWGAPCIALRVAPSVASGSSPRTPPTGALTWRTRVTFRSSGYADYLGCR